jgi:hypothetical protein
VHAIASRHALQKRCWVGERLSQVYNDIFSWRRDGAAFSRREAAAIRDATEVRGDQANAVGDVRGWEMEHRN